MHETGMADYGDIFEGSKVIEKLTAETDGRARAKSRFECARPATRAPSRSSAAELTRQLAERHRKLESGEIMQIGVNAFTGEIGLAPRAASGTSITTAQATRGKRTHRLDQKMARSRATRRRSSKAREKLERAVANAGDAD